MEWEDSAFLSVMGWGRGVPRRVLVTDEHGGGGSPDTYPPDRARSASELLHNSFPLMHTRDRAYRA